MANNEELFRKFKIVKEYIVDNIEEQRKESVCYRATCGKTDFSVYSVSGLEFTLKCNHCGFKTLNHVHFGKHEEYSDIYYDYIDYIRGE